MVEYGQSDLVSTPPLVTVSTKSITPCNPFNDPTFRNHLLKRESDYHTSTRVSTIPSPWSQVLENPWFYGGVTQSSGNRVRRETIRNLEFWSSLNLSTNGICRGLSNQRTLRH